MRKILLGSAVLLIAGLILVASLFARLEAEVVGAEFLQQLEREAGIRVESESFTLHPWRGLGIADAKVSGRLESGVVLATISLLRVEHQVFPLLWGELVLDEIVVDDAVVDWQTPSAEMVREQKAKNRELRRQAREARKKGQKPKELAKQEALDFVATETNGRIRLGVNRLQIRNATLRIETSDGNEIEFAGEEIQAVLEDISFDPKIESKMGSMSGSGDFSTGRVVHGDIKALRTRGRLALSGGTATLTDTVIESVNTRLTVEKMAVAVTQKPLTYAIEASGYLDLNGVLDVESRNGFGGVEVRFVGSGEGPEFQQMTGSGAAILAAGAIAPIASIVQVEDLVGQDLLTGRRYETTQIDYVLDENRLVLQPFEFKGEGADIAGEGWIDLAGPIDLEMRVRLPSPSSMTGSGFEGSLGIPFRIAGTIDDPSASLGTEGMQEFAKEVAPGWLDRALEEAKEKAAEWLESRPEEDDE